MSGASNMTTIRLGQLFDCEVRGGALVAEAADGSLVHVDNVVSGLGCQCRCPGCERRMVAKKGSVQSHHFAHHSVHDGSICTSAGETALHKFAKALLDERLEFGLPAMIVESGTDREEVVRPARFRFERAVLEKKAGSVVPDVVLELRNRRLIVEFKVTHACDDVKIARIRSMNIGAVEINLSAYRDRPLDALAEEILFNAPRIWLHNPLEMNARERLAEKSRMRAEARQKEIQKYSSKYCHRRRADRNGSGACEVSARRDGLGALINLDVAGTGCFTVAVADWQAAVLAELLAHNQKPFRTRNGLSCLTKRGWVHGDFRSISDDIATEIKKSESSFASPFGAVEGYLARLEQLGFLQSAPSEIWRPTSSILQLIDEAKQLLARPATRLAEIREIISQQLKSLPEGEIASFVFETWIESPLPYRTLSVADALHSEEPVWLEICRTISNIRTSIRFSPRRDLDMAGLPFSHELERAIERKRQEAEERDRQRREAEKAAIEARMKHLRDLAQDEIGAHAHVWLTTPVETLNGLSPLDAAATPEGATAAARLLSQKARELDEEERAQRTKEKAIAELEKLAQARYYDSEHATLWMRSSRRELGGKSPAEFTVDEETRKQCEGYLPKKLSYR